VQGLIERSGLEITLDISEHFGRLPRDLEIAVFRLVQEALTNIHRHSSSKTASIRVARENGGVVADIRDLGKGMSAEKLAEIQSGGSGLGIRGMRERLRPFHGTLNIQSDHNGTSILATIPISPAVAGREQTPLKAAG
jgi:signal transduction histidine kinase